MGRGFLEGTPTCPLLLCLHLNPLPSAGAPHPKSFLTSAHADPLSSRVSPLSASPSPVWVRLGRGLLAILHLVQGRSVPRRSCSGRPQSFACGPPGTLQTFPLCCSVGITSRSEVRALVGGVNTDDPSQAFQLVPI